MKLFVAALSFVVFAGFGLAEEKKKFDPASIQGKWKFTEGTKFGTKVDEQNLKSDVTITKDTITIKAADETHVMSFKLDATKSPIEINLEGKEGASKGATAEGIIEVDGDTLKLAYSTSIAGFDGKRPTKFESTKDGKSFFFVLKKAK